MVSPYVVQRSCYSSSMSLRNVYNDVLKKSWPVCLKRHQKNTQLINGYLCLLGLDQCRQVSFQEFILMNLSGMCHELGLPDMTGHFGIFWKSRAFLAFRKKSGHFWTFPIQFSVDKLWYPPTQWGQTLGPGKVTGVNCLDTLQPYPIHRSFKALATYLDYLSLALSLRSAFDPRVLGTPQGVCR